MVYECKSFGVKCDGCGTDLEYDVYAIWQDECGAIDAANDSDWVLTDDGKAYCPGCADKRGIAIEE